MLTSKESLMIVKSTIDLAHDLGKKVVAEGVETQAQWNKLSVLGCDIAQGYFIAKPMPVDVFLNWIKDFKLTGTSPQGRG
jgi:EAL domain-containing protein (putative c-di-GMP-specific phosphodiesterase class I)